MVATAGSGVVLGLRGLRLWRAVRSFGRSTTRALVAVTDAATATEAHALAVAQRTERLTAATERLHESLARLGVLADAVSDLRRSVTGIRGLVPKK